MKILEQKPFRYLAILLPACFLSIPAALKAQTSWNLDLTFNGSGIVTTAAGIENSRPRSMTIQSDGKIVVAGYSQPISGSNFMVVRYNTDGSLDTTFNGTGKVATLVGTNSSSARGVALQSDGKIVCAGYSIDAQWTTAVVRYNTDGSLDMTFNGTGIVKNAVGSGNSQANSVIVQSDGKIVTVVSSINGNSRSIFTVVRYNNDGSLDTTFNGTGIVTTSVGNGNSHASSVALQSDGKIVAAGNATDPPGLASFAVVRYNTDGSLDTTFRGTGVVRTPVGTGHSYANGVAVQSDGKIVSAGNSDDPAGFGVFTVVRYRVVVSRDVIIEQPAGTPLVDAGAIPVDFGPVLLGNSGSREFKIRNTGVVNLTGLAVTLAAGGNPGDFSVGTLGAATLAPGASTNFTVTFSPTEPAPRTATLLLASNDPDENPFVVSLAGIGGNNLPTLTDIVNQTINQNTNTGALAFSVGDVETAPVALVATGSSSNTALVPDANIVFAGAGAARTVTVTPILNQSGVATITISVSDGADTVTDTFLLTVNPPDITVEQPVSTDLADGIASVAFGSVNVGAAGAPVSFTVRNTGPAVLTLGTLTTDGTNPGDFIVDSAGMLTTVTAGNSTTFTVTFTPAAGGARSVVLHLVSNDSDENPFDIILTGVGSIPEIVVEQPAGTDLLDGPVTRDFGSVNLGSSAPLTFTVRNAGSGPLSGLAVTKNGSHAGDFLVAGLVAATLAPGASTTFTVSFSPMATGVRSSAIHFASDDADENPFDITLTGTGTAPEIVVEQPLGTPLADGAATMGFGSANVGTGVPLTFTIRNTGTGPLSGLVISKDGSHSLDFTVAGPVEDTLAAGTSTTFSVTFNPAAAGTRAAAIHIGSNDADENPFDINLTGTGTVPEIDLEQSPGSRLTDGVGSVSFGTVNLGSSTVLTFTVRSSGSGPLTGLAISKDGSNAGDFTVSALGASTLAAGASQTFTVTFAPAATGTRMAAIHITSNDADENLFDINLTGIGRPVPEIVVEQPSGTGLTDGSAVPVDFGKVASGTSVSRIFTIRNTGTANLTGITVTLNGGTAAGDYSIWDLGATSLAPGAAATFQVFFLPGGPGARTTTLLIASNDADENPFEINLTGMQTSELEVWRQTYFGSTANSGAGADLSDPDRDGVANLMEFATGSGPWTLNVQPGEFLKNGSSLEFTWPRRKAALAEIIYAVEWSESLAGPWSAAGVNTAVFTDGSVMQEMKSTLPAGGGGRRFVRLRVTRL